ncbi:MAG: glycosyltransferase family 2 protein [Lachnospiraceae bacterium]|nr:glycosyltransferase family 2 protein [Lachnospiraceae bacterium]
MKQKMEDIKITVFTPTYNRAYIISVLYQSLKRQSFKNFEWLVVDDGSQDETEELLKQWINENNDFPIRYFRQKNGGKCCAINKGLELARGELFFTVDSDDYLTDDALEKINIWEKELSKKQRYCGFAGNLGISECETPNHLFKEKYYEGSALDRYGKVDGERAMVFYTEVHRKYMYPIFSEERFMTEAVTWNRMAHDGYKMRFYNDIIWIYEYREDGLTKSGSRLFIDNPKGYGLWLRERAIFLKYNWIEKIKMYYTFICDLSGKYTLKQCSEFIGASENLMNLLWSGRTIVSNLKKMCK